MSDVKQVTDGNFEEIITTNGNCVMQFSAAWCGPCRAITPIVETLATENEDVYIGKVDVDGNKDVAVKYGIRGIPAILFFKDGEVVDRTTGVQTKDELQTKINQLKG